MRKLIRFTSLTMMLVAAFVSMAAQSPSVIPIPLSTINRSGTLRISNGAVVAYPQADAGAKFAAMHFVDLVKRTRGIILVVAPLPTPPKTKVSILITRYGPSTSQGPEAQNAEAYDLDLTTDHATISSSTDAGLFYGTVTLWQLLTATEVETGPAVLNCVNIHDQPQLRWRGIMLDSARHMQSIEFIHQLIDWMALEKLNMLHWHLVDDQGWRLEIKRYPKLTQVGAWRQLFSPTGQMGGPAGITAQSLRYGGYYSQVQVRELVAYAKQRNITIVPEIEMPGHASAALASYPEFGSSKIPLTAPASTYGIHPSLYNVNDATFTFIENVLTEVMELFPSEYIHVGGDEAFKAQWQASPEIQAKMKSLGLTNEDQLQSYFIKRIDTFLTAHHRHTIGWDEILQGGLAPGAAVMSWHGIQGGIDAAKQGHDAVLTPTRPLYLNYRQSEGTDEAPGRWALNTLENVYDFNPAPDSLTPQQRSHILGVQGSLWSEYVIGPEHDEWMIFPRAAALAEIGWSPTDHRNWNDFLVRLVAETRRYRALGIDFDPAIFRVRSTERILSNKSEVQVTLTNQSKYGTIHYSINGAPVTAKSPKYDQPLTLRLPTHLRAATFDGSEIYQSDLDRHLDEFTVRTKYSQQLKLCSESPVIGMEQDPPHGERPVSLANYQNPCWIDTAVDLTNAHSISVGVMSLPYLFAGSGIVPSPQQGDKPASSGELEVHLDTCTGTLLTALSFEPAVGRLGVIKLQATLPKVEGNHDLCLKVVRPEKNPLWVIDWIQIAPPSKH